jgi:ribose 5-phosphate isomerase A
MSPKQRAAEAAVELLRSDSIIGLGTGSTAECFHVALGAALRSGKLKNIRGVPTSEAAKQHARELGIPVATLHECPHPDVTVDGADEITPSLDLIKGLGGAMLREKIVAQASRKLIIIADDSKTVDALGTKSPLPVEVVQFEHEIQVEFLKTLDCVPTLRLGKDGKPFVTDNGNYIYDCKFDAIRDPRKIELAIKSRAGLVETGLFLGIASVALVADDKSVRKIEVAR